jgi:hypothetical protein
MREADSGKAPHYMGRYQASQRGNSFSIPRLSATLHPTPQLQFSNYFAFAHPGDSAALPALMASFKDHNAGGPQPVA